MGYRSFLVSTLVVCGLIGTSTALAQLKQAEIRWSNNSVWTRVAADSELPLIGGCYVFNGRIAQVLSTNSSTLVVVNENGSRAPAHFIAADRIQVPNWGNLEGDVAAEGITWANGSKWDKIPDLSGSYRTAGKIAQVAQNCALVEFINENDPPSTSVGLFINGKTIKAANWGDLTADLSDPNVISWANGSKWERGDSNAPGAQVAGVYSFNGKVARFLQANPIVTAINENGSRTGGAFTGENTFNTTGWNITGEFFEPLGDIHMMFASPKELDVLPIGNNIPVKVLLDGVSDTDIVCHEWKLDGQLVPKSNWVSGEQNASETGC